MNRDINVPIIYDPTRFYLIFYAPTWSFYTTGDDD